MAETRTVQLTDYLRAIRRRWPVVLALTLVVTAAAVTTSLLATPQYDATAQLLLRSGQVESLLEPGGAQSSDRERSMNTDVELIKLDAIAEAVRRRLEVPASPGSLLEQLETETRATSDIVTLRVRDPDPARAAAVVNAFAQEYVAYRQRSARAALLEAAEVAETEYQSLTPEDQASPEGQQLRARSRQFRITAALQTGGVEIIRRAKEPTSPSRPRPRLSAALGLLLGLALGIALALILEFTDRRIRTEEDVEEIFDLPILASIPPPPRRSVDDHVQREAFGLLAANLRLSGRSGEPAVLMITSPGPGDGKTSVTFGVARAFARLGLRVIAIEADLRRPTFAERAPVSASAGVTALIGEPAPIARELVWLDASTLLPVTPENLKEGLAFAVLPAGRIPPHPQRVLARPEMAAIVEQARSLADVVLIDTPPIGTVNDAITLARLVDTAVVVAQLGQTTKDAARRALRGLRGLDVGLAGTVVTNASEALQYGYYGHDTPPAERGEVPSG
ncbi:MAG TPA: Wzz/FepE/Etk N-terminal domain-containing protein [Solirubrobacteraceae bacterium]|nr:Wzz/FepE/Etk N-terminal domain-containing protein [Solirubrobacteraceae bacterium]